MTQRNSPERREMLDARLVARFCRVPGFTPVRSSRRFSTRGQRRPTYFSKKHTPSRLRDLQEDRAV